VIGKQHVVVSLDDHIDHLSGVSIDQHILDVADLFTSGVLEIVQVVVGQLVVEQILVHQGGQTQEVTGVQPQAGSVNDAAIVAQRADVEGHGHRLGSTSRPDQPEFWIVRLHAGNGLQLYVIPRYDALDAVEVDYRELQRAFFVNEDVRQLAGGLV